MTQFKQDQCPNLLLLTVAISENVKHVDKVLKFEIL